MTSCISYMYTICILYGIMYYLIICIVYYLKYISPMYIVWYYVSYHMHSIFSYVYLITFIVLDLMCISSHVYHLNNMLS